MQQSIQLQLTPSQHNNPIQLRAIIAETLGYPESAITGFYKLKQSIDARSRSQIWFNITFQVYINEPFEERKIKHISFQPLKPQSPKVIIVGAGPAGLFAALKLLEHGIQPIIVERGKDIRSRRRDLAALNKQGSVNPESNYCFGEGGAGTYSDGKLYTRSNKRGDINRILNLFVQFGASEQILFESHPHIGTNKLPHIITNMREAIIGNGGIVLFETKMTDLILKDNRAIGISTQHGEQLFADAVILATGHSARDIFELLHEKQILIEAKPFALGIRIEHPQNIINNIQYHCSNEDAMTYLPPASYSLVHQANGRGVFSFCMCPGGIIAPAATNPNELVVNGWSPSKRNNPFANSGMVVTVSMDDAIHYFKNQDNHNKKKSAIATPLTLMQFQAAIEQRAFSEGGGNLVAPAQRMVDFCNNKVSTNMPDCSYLPGVQSSALTNVLPSFIVTTLQQGLKAFGNKMKGYYTNEALLVATESRTSSPVRIPRNTDTLQHPQVANLFPCGEGAGYAGGIVSAAMDGERVADVIVQQLQN
jgi:uncharacterized protein